MIPLSQSNQLSVDSLISFTNHNAIYFNIRIYTSNYFHIMNDSPALIPLLIFANMYRYLLDIVSLVQEFGSSQKNLISNLALLRFVPLELCDPIPFLFFLVLSFVTFIVTMA